MEKKTKITDKGFARYLGVEDEAEDESTLQETAAIPETGGPTDEQNIENTMHSEPARNTGNMPVQKRVSAKMKKETLEAYKQAYLVPTRLSNRKAVYLSREHRSVPTSSCVGWATGEATFQVSWRTSCASIWRNMVRT